MLREVIILSRVRLSILAEQREEESSVFLSILLGKIKLQKRNPAKIKKKKMQASNLIEVKLGEINISEDSGTGLSVPASTPPLSGLPFTSWHSALRLS